MTSDEWKNTLDEQDRRLLIKTKIPEHDKLIKYLRRLLPTTGFLDKMFCNGFMIESVELLKHGIFLYEDGYFDCAFYSVRQSIENMNNMLFLSQSEDELVKWKAKERFPSDSQIKIQLQQINAAYSEIKTAIPEMFNLYDELLKKANKYIHKQGFDTFYLYQWQQEKPTSNRTKLFVDLLKQSIGLLLIINIILDPLSLALSDPEVDAHIQFDPMTERIPTYIFDELFSCEVIEKIKETSFYKEFISCFLEKEEMNAATYGVIRFCFFDVDDLDEIEKQINLLDYRQSLCFDILKSGIQVSHFYFDDDFLGYSTSIEPTHELKEHRSDMFDSFTIGNGESNINWNGMFISIYKAFENYIILQHNKPFTKSSIAVIKSIIDNKNEQYNEFKTLLNELEHAIK